MGRADRKLSVPLEHTGDRQKDAMQAPVRGMAKAFNNVPFMRGRLISVSLVANTTLVVNHGLGVPAACFRIRQNYEATTFPTLTEVTPQPAGLDPNRQIAIQANVSCLLDLWFYPRSSKVIPQGASQSP